MKFKSLVRLGVVLLCGSVVSFVLAQQLVPASAGSKLNDAIALLNDGKPREAKDSLAAIDKADSEFAAAQCYTALCLYELEDYLAFLKQMDAPTIEEAGIASDVRENLAFKQVDALFRFRKFDDVQAKIESFQKNHPSSPQLSALAEYRMVALFERGMKRARNSTLIEDAVEFQAKWSEGKANLEQFLLLAGADQDAHYAVLPKRSLGEDVWVARLTLGDEKAALAEISADDAEGREKLLLLRAQLYQKLQPHEVDRNLRMMAEFLEEFPASAARKRIQFDMAGLSFQRGKEISMEIEAAEQSGDGSSAREKRAAASRYFEFLRSLQREAAVDKAAGIEASDIFDLREDLLYSYLLEKDYTAHAALTSSLLGNSEPGDLDWMLAKLYDAIALMVREPAHPVSAAPLFDELLALGFKNKPDHDRLVTIAGRWRLSIALKAGDTERAKQVILSVHEGECAKPIKKAFLADYAGLAGLQSDSTK